MLEDASRFGAQLAKLDVESTRIPLQKVNFFPIVSHVDDVQALLFTSKNGVRAFCETYPQRDFLVYCVGNGTAELAKNLGFKRVYSAEGNVNNLRDLVQQRANPAGKVLLHISGKDVREPLEKLLPEFPIERIVGYEIVDHFELTEEKLKALRDPHITHVCLFSPKSGERFAKVLKKYNCEDSCAKRTCVAFSEDVADTIRAMTWKDIKILPNPSLDAMLEYFHDIRSKDNNS